MVKLNCVGFEPMSDLHHAYIDYIWQQYRNDQTGDLAQTDYPENEGMYLSTSFVHQCVNIC